MSEFYAQAADIKVRLDEEEHAWATLRMLEGDPNRLGPNDIPMIRNALQQARNFAFRVTLNSKVQLERRPGECRMTGARSLSRCSTGRGRKLFFPPSPRPILALERGFVLTSRTQSEAGKRRQMHWAFSLMCSKFGD